MNILDQIIANKKKEIERSRQRMPVNELEQMAHFKRTPLSLKNALLHENSTGIIAEYKRRSPSKGIINDRDNVESVTGFYTAYGAAGLSILTDGRFFGGSLDDLSTARDNPVPILRKDFIIDEYQLVEAKAYGADVVLLIAACLSPHRIKTLSAIANNTGLEVLVELHDESELQHICPQLDLIGVNNRNLKTFEVDLEHSARLSHRIGNDFVRVAESGINSVDTIRYLKQVGFKGFLIGEYFMKQEDPGKAFKEFTNSL
jgi:indole-3-glycerol phosphate synthase